jgi:hypothetical protein
MLKKVITFTDYDGNERTETFFFNLSKAEVTEMELSLAGGLVKTIEKIVEERQDYKRDLEERDERRKAAKAWLNE